MTYKHIYYNTIQTYIATPYKHIATSQWSEPFFLCRLPMALTIPIYEGCSYSMFHELNLAEHMDVGIKPVAMATGSYQSMIFRW